MLRNRGAFTQSPGFDPRATIPTCSISANRNQLATGSFISQEQWLRYSLCGGCCGSMCCSARRYAGHNPGRVYRDSPVAPAQIGALARRPWVLVVAQELKFSVANPQQAKLGIVKRNCNEAVRLASGIGSRVGTRFRDWPDVDDLRVLRPVVG